MLHVDCYLMTEYLLSKVPRGETLMVHEPGVLLSRILHKFAAEKGVYVFLTSSNREEKSACTYIHPCTTENNIARIAQKFVSLFVDWSARQSQMDVGARIATTLASSCDVEYLKMNFARGHHSTLQANSFQVCLNNAYSRALTDTVDHHLHYDAAIINIQDIQNSQFRYRPAKVIDWGKLPTVEVAIQPLDQMIRFSNDKTYWLVGLTESLGVSLCDWMVQHGAKNIVLSSRNPKIDKRWVDSLTAAGVNVKVFAGYAYCNLTTML